ncbi:MAG TPA: hypothetical protein PLR65_07200 [Anaerolineales bacterium]|nr:hypothetical protein [Anaerolineales bacterium]
MTEDNLLRQAIAAARAGRELGARDMFLQVIEAEPRNELAWMWLIDLLDDLDDRIYACEQVLAINAGNLNARHLLIRLQAERQQQVEEQRIQADEQARHIRELVKERKLESALELARSLAQRNINHADVWRSLAQLSPDADEKIRSLEKLLALTPEDIQVKRDLQRLKHFQQNPMELAEMYEEQGNFEQAISVYGQVAANTKSKRQWNMIYWRIVKLENLLQENIARIPPGISVARLTGGPALLYLLLMLIQTGINPFAHPEPFLWFGFLLVLFGGFMIALASVRSRHRLWYLLFKDVGAGGAPAARALVASAGWCFVLLPHVMLVLMAYQRLVNSILWGSP